MNLHVYTLICLVQYVYSLFSRVFFNGRKIIYMIIAGLTAFRYDFIIYLFSYVKHQIILTIILDIHPLSAVIFKL